MRLPADVAALSGVVDAAAAQGPLSGRRGRQTRVEPERLDPRAEPAPRIQMVVHEPVARCPGCGRWQPGPILCPTCKAAVTRGR